MSHSTLRRRITGSEETLVDEPPTAPVTTFNSTSATSSHGSSTISTPKERPRHPLRSPTPWPDRSSTSLFRQKEKNKDVEASRPQSRPVKQQARLPNISGIKLWILVAILFVGLLLSTLEQLIVGTALTNVTSELGGYNSASWVVTAYLMMYNGTRYGLRPRHR
jgi:hypothetical protein